MASPKSRPRDGYPGRALGLILVIMVALVAIMFGTGNTKPRLGIDLAGGASVTLKATSPDPQAINPANMAIASAIMLDRVNGTGVTESTVQVQGNDEIVINIPKGTNSTTIANELAQTAKLYFRPVLAEQQQVNAADKPKTSASPSASSTGGAKPSPSASSSDKAKASGSGAATSPSPSKTQGDAVSKALTAGSSASPHASTSASAKASTSAAASSTAQPAASPTTSATGTTSGPVGGTVPTALQKQFDATDCTTEKGRSAAQLAANNAKETDQVVTCSKDANSGIWTKYALAAVAVDGTHISKAQSNLSTQNGQWEVDLSFDSHGSSAFANVTGLLAKNQTPANEFAIQLDGLVQSAPYVSSAITGGQATISGSFDQDSANSLANVLSYGSLPLNFQQQEVVTVSPELGSSQLTAGLIAGLIGLILVVLYSVAYYRGLGLVAVASLAVSGILTWSLMSLLGGAIGFALNLPAVCGAIVAIGITADSFVVYFERIRDELREGASLRPAVRNAWPRARRTILVSDFVSFLAAAVLYFFTVGKVQGFAFTLGLTTLLDVVVVFLFTKPLMTLLARRKFFASGHPWSGLSPERLGVRNPLRDSRNSRRPARPTAGKEA